MSCVINPFSNIQLSINDNVITVQYTVDPSFTGLAPYTYELMAFEDDTFTDPVYTIPSTTYYAVDDLKIRENQLPNFLYKVKLITHDDVSYLSEFIGWHESDSMTHHKYLLASDISRRERVRFNYVGVFGYILKRKNYGPIQTGDVDPVTGEPVLDNTSTFGVGMTGGYYTPVLARFSIESRQTKTDYAEDGRGSQYTELLSLRCAGFPYIDQHDIIVTHDSKRFTVIDSNTKYFPGTTMILLQSPSLRLVPVTDTIYSIAVPAFPTK